MTWATAWSGESNTPGERSFSRRNVPPHLVNAIDQERLHWALHIKGLDRSHAEFFARNHQAVVRTIDGGPYPRGSAANRDFNIYAALREIERLTTVPTLLPRGRDAQRRMADMERWFCQEVAPAALWCVNQPSANRLGVSEPMDQQMCVPITKALDLVAGLTRKHQFLMGDVLTFADVAAASVLAPVAREQGWAWADTQGTTARNFPKTESWREHKGAAWVRDFYEHHGKTSKRPQEPQRAWLP